MKKKTKRLFFLAGAAGCTMAAAIWLLPGTSAYFTDHESVWNRMVFGHNTSTIDEEFPTPTPVPPGKSVVYPLSHLICVMILLCIQPYEPS